MRQLQPAEVLLVDDDEDAATITQAAFARAGTGIQARVHHVSNGDAGLRFLRRLPPYEEAPRPHLVLLDLEMPQMGGREVMAQIAHDPELCYLPVIILSSRDDPETVQDLYRMRCSSFLAKPVDFEQAVRNIGTLAKYWLETVVLPRQES